MDRGQVWQERGAAGKMLLSPDLLSCLQTPPRPRARLWPWLPLGLSSTEAQHRCGVGRALRREQRRLDAACKKPAEVSPLRGEKPNRRLTILLPLTQQA